MSGEFEALIQERQQSARLCEERARLVTDIKNMMETYWYDTNQLKDALKSANTALIDYPCFCVDDGDSPPCKRCVALAKINKLLK